LIAVFSALEEEIRDFKTGMSIRKISSYRCCRMYEGKYGEKECVLVLTGMGGEHARQVTQLIVSTYPVSALISTGFGGSLNSKTGVGDVVIYSKLCDGAKAPVPGIQPELISDSKLVAAASTLKGNSFQTLVGRGLTLSEVCSLPANKLELGQKFAADIVDMESYSIGQTALERNYPFIAVRSVFDCVEDDLTPLNSITTGGRLSPGRACSHLIVHPGDIRKLFGFSRNAVKARKNLALFLSALLEKME
jgi:nucleoside phosphorylase